MLRKKPSSNLEHRVLPSVPLATGERMVPFNAAMVPLPESPPHSPIALPFNTQHEEKTSPIAANSLPPSAPVQLPTTDITLPSQRHPTAITIRTSRQSRDSGYNASASCSSANPSPQAFTFSPHEAPDFDNRTVEIAELIGDNKFSNLDTIPTDWTLIDMINHIIDNDIILPSEEEIDGCNRDANAAVLPILHTPAFYDEYESALVDFARANPGLRPVDDLKEIGKNICYEDPVTGRMRKRMGEFNPADPRHPDRRAGAGR
ncbi:MAG: hypothetical protein Q9221_000229 [Calogaya cf. arnoldii]